MNASGVVTIEDGIKAAKKKVKEANKWVDETWRPICAVSDWHQDRDEAQWQLGYWEGVQKTLENLLNSKKKRVAPK